MGHYRTTVILKTDIVNSTLRLSAQTQAEMGSQRKQHKQFIAETAIQHHGSVFDEEGDGYWIEFPSVTDAVLTAIDMHQSLRTMQAGKGEKQRLAIRAAIAVGDILHHEKETIGMTMSLTARIANITPPDEIYLSHAAWLVLNKAEVQTSRVDKFNLKGFSEPETIYKVDQKHKIRVLRDQFIVFTDLRGWSNFTTSSGLETVENVLSDYDDLLNEICNQHGGIIRNTSGDQYFLTFSEAGALFAAMENLCESWKGMIRRYQLGLSASVHRGDLNIIRSYLYSNDIHTTYFLEHLNRLMHPDTKTISVAISGRVRDSVEGTTWTNRFYEVDSSTITDARLKSIIEEHGAYWFITKDIG